MKVVSFAAVAVACVAQVNAHVYLTQPLAEFKSGASQSSWVAEFKNPWAGTTVTNAAQYATAAKANGLSDLKSFLDDKGPACGNSLPDAKPKAIPSDGTIKLASTIEHPGPCEVWLDGTRAFHNDDCEAAFGSATSFKMDFSSCKGSCMLRFYWLGLQDKGGRWQSYKNCVPLGGGSGGGSSSAKSTDSAATSSDKSTNNNAQSNNSKNTSNNSKSNSSAKSDSTNKSSSSTKNSDSTNKSSSSTKNSDSTKSDSKSSSTKNSDSKTQSKSNEKKRSFEDNEYSFNDLNAWNAPNNATSQ